jgi:hypothetical protein
MKPVTTFRHGDQVFRWRSKSLDPTSDDYEIQVGTVVTGTQRLGPFGPQLREPDVEVLWPHHATEWVFSTSIARVDDLIRELAMLLDEWTEEEDCDHSVGMCMCSTKSALETANLFLTRGGVR